MNDYKMLLNGKPVSASIVKVYGPGDFNVKVNGSPIPRRVTSSLPLQHKVHDTVRVNLAVTGDPTTIQLV